MVHKNKLILEKRKSNKDMKETKKKNKKDTKIVVIIFFVLILAPVIVGILLLWNKIPREHEIEELVYEEDYASIYSEEIKIVFGPSCIVGEKKDITYEGESCSCGYHRDTVIYNEWEITYQDQYGQTFVQTMDNVDSFEQQQIDWMINQMEEHYRANLFKDYFDPDTLEGYQPVSTYGSNYVYVMYGNHVNSYSTDKEEREMKAAEEKGVEYNIKLLKELSSKENMIHLYELDYSKVYSTYPLKLIVHISDCEEGVLLEQQREYEQICEGEMDDLVAAIMDEAGGTCNLEFKMQLLYGENIEDENAAGNTHEFSYYRSIIGGEDVDFGDYEKSYDQLLYYWYNENIW